MHLVIISGMSGGGKSLAIHTLEDQGYYCIDNLPLEFLESVFETSALKENKKVAIGIDVRSDVNGEYLEKFPEQINNLQNRFKTDVVYLYAGKSVLLKRFDESRRKHPLFNSETTLKDSLSKEYELLAPVRKIADLKIDTSTTDIYELAEIIRTRICGTEKQSVSLLFQSFGFKYGTPRDSDYLFDVRCLPNPYWIPELRAHTGQEQEVIDWLSSQALVQKMENDLTAFIEDWIPEILKSQRAYLTISIGCTGGHHRSVYLVEKLSAHFNSIYTDCVITQHRELD